MPRPFEGSIHPSLRDTGPIRPVHAPRDVGLSFLVWPVVAFWGGTAMFFVFAAGAAAWQFAGGLMRARGDLARLEPIYVIWLLLVLFFLASGVSGGILAWFFARRRRLAYYGSLVGALWLSFAGPLVSILPAQPDYFVTISLALLPMLVLLLTLGSGVAFDEM